MTGAGVAPAAAHKKLALVCVAMGIFMVMLDTTIVNVALPEIRADLGYLTIQVSELQWVVNSYTIALAVFLLTAGKLGDMFGRKRLFIIGLIIFTAGSLACGLSSEIGQLIAFRAVQGVGAAIITPTTLSIISATFAPHERGTALAVWSAVVGFGAAIGPLIGGILTQQGEWNWIFYVNIPIGILTVIATLVWVGESRDPSEERSLDVGGLVLAGVGLFALTFALLQANEYGWTDPRIIGLFVISVFSFAALVLVEKRARLPMIDLSLFRSSTFTGANLLGVFVGFLLVGEVFYLSLYLQNILAYTPTETGLALLPMTAMLMPSAGIAGRLTDTIGPRIPLLIGFAVMVPALLLVSTVDFDSSFTALLPGLILSGIGLGFALTPLTAAALAGVPVHQAGIGAGVLNALRQAGSALGLAVLGAISAAITSATLDSGGTRPEGFIDSFGPIMQFSAVIAAAGFIIALLTVSRQTLEAPEGAPHIPAAAASAIMAMPEAKPSALMVQPSMVGGQLLSAPLPGSLQLEVVAGPAKGKKITVGREPFVIGRAESGDGRLGEDPELSRLHAKVSVGNGRLTVEDLGSTNGTAVNGSPITEPVTVGPGDSIDVGTSKLQVVGAVDIRLQPTRVGAAIPAPAIGRMTLRVTRGPAEGTTLEVGAGDFVIGRAEPGAGRLGNDPEISRRHASISAFDGARLLVEDLGSTNGTLVNNNRITAPTVVTAGDTVSLGGTTLEVVA